MRLLLVFIGLAALLAVGCGGSPAANNADASNANSAQVETFTDANLALAEGNRLLDENQTQAAINVLKQAIQLNPDLAEAHFKLGIAYDLREMQNEREGVVGEASTNSKDARKKTNAEISFENAVIAYKKWIDSNPKDDAAHFYLGRTYAKLTKDDEAEESFSEAVKLKPDDTEYQTELGAILIKLALYREAIAPLKKAIELDPANGRAIDLLEDAEAGRRRVDYVSPKNTNQNANKPSNTNANSAMNSNSNSAPKPPEANAKPKPTEPKDGRPRMIANKPR